MDFWAGDEFLRVFKLLRCCCIIESFPSADTFSVSPVGIVAVGLLVHLDTP